MKLKPTTKTTITFSTGPFTTEDGPIEYPEGRYEVDGDCWEDYNDPHYLGFHGKLTADGVWGHDSFEQARFKTLEEAMAAIDKAERLA